MRYSKENPPFGGSFEHGSWIAVKYHNCPCSKCEEARGRVTHFTRADQKIELGVDMFHYMERISLVS